MFQSARSSVLAPVAPEPPSVCARLWREAPPGLPRVAARNALASAVRTLAADTLAHRCLPCDVVDDLAHDLTCRVLSRIEGGHVCPGHEDAYVRAAARNRANDHCREQSGLRELPVPDDEANSPFFHEETAERLLLDREEMAEHESRLTSLHAAIQEAPPRYRRALEHVYLEGRAVEDLVFGELASRGAETHDARERRRARGAIDKVLERARSWIRKHLGLGGGARQP